MDDSRGSDTSRGLFSFSFTQPVTGKPSASEELSTSLTRGAATGTSSRWVLDRVVLEGSQPSPAVVRTAPGSHALRRKSGVAVERIQKSLGALDEVIGTEAASSFSPSSSSLRPPPHLPGSLLKEVFRSSTHGAPATVAGGAMATPPQRRGPTRLTQTPENSAPQTSSLSIMNESGFTQKFLVAPTPVRDVNNTTRALGSVFGTSSLDRTTFMDTSVLQPQKGAESDAALAQDPAMTTSRDLINSFHRCYSAHPQPSSVLALAQALEECCETQLAELKKLEEQTKTTLAPQILTDLTLEQGTWQLLHVLYSDRVATEMEEEEELEAGGDLMEDSLMTGGSDKEVAENFFGKDATVRQAQLVVDWLEKNALVNLEKYPTKVHYFADDVTWENTLHDIRNGIGRDYLITEMDPDAPTRQGRRLSELDAKDEASLVKHLFTCVRAGRVSEAQDLCINCGQPWRAASLEGWRLYHDPNRGKTLHESELEEIEGNFARALWKISCWELAAEPSYTAYERALYASLSGNLKQILPVCQSWFDNVWAYFKVMVDVLTEQQLRASRQCTGEVLEGLPTDYWNAVVVPEVIFQEIEASPSQVVRKDSRNHFHLMQKYIILGDMEGLVGEMAKLLADSPSVYQLRFMAHMVLFIGGLGVPVDDEKATGILEAYVKELVRGGYSSLVALYTARLPPPLQVSCYAMLLEGVDDPDHRKLCLDLGKEAGLDLAVITKSVVETIRDVGTEDLLNTTTVELGTEVEITKLDKGKIEAINWLVFDEAQRLEAIRQGNALIRQFLAMRKYSAAREVFKKIPRDSVELVTRRWRSKSGDAPLPIDVSNDIREYYSIQAYLDANDSFNNWFQFYHHRRPEAPCQPVASQFKAQVTFEHLMKQYQTEYGEWEQQLRLHTEECTAKLYGVLQFEGGWMVDQLSNSASPSPAVPAAGEPSRPSQLSLLRQLCLPQTTFLLHTVLHSTQEYQECLRLADVVASGSTELFQVFRQDELQKFLALLQSSAMALLEDQTTDGLGYLL